MSRALLMLERTMNVLCHLEGGREGERGGGREGGRGEGEGRTEEGCACPRPAFFAQRA